MTFEKKWWELGGVLILWQGGEPGLFKSPSRCSRILSKAIFLERNFVCFYEIFLDNCSANPKIDFCKKNSRCLQDKQLIPKIDKFPFGTKFRIFRLIGPLVLSILMKQTNTPLWCLSIAQIPVPPSKLLFRSWVLPDLQHAIIRNRQSTGWQPTLCKLIVSVYINVCRLHAHTQTNIIQHIMYGYVSVCTLVHIVCMSIVFIKVCCDI